MSKNNEFGANAKLSQTAKMRMLDVVHGEIDRRKNPRGQFAVVLTDEERAKILDTGALALDPTEYKTP